MSEIFILFAMLQCHILDDFVLQAAFLAKGKQRTWWEKNAPDEKYYLDYTMCLVMHSMSWAFSILLPFAISVNFNVRINYLVAFMINALIHYVVDDLKANFYKLNLVQDQFIHILQIATTFVFLIKYGV